jgi:urease alpha subunit
MKAQDLEASEGIAAGSSPYSGAISSRIRFRGGKWRDRLRDCSPGGNDMKNLSGTSVVAALALVTTALSSQAQDYDLVISKGRVMDPETLYDGVANVAITDGRIVAISREPLTGAEEIDATGHVVAPGFIDTHFHWQAPLGYALGLRDGVTMWIGAQ